MHLVLTEQETFMCMQTKPTENTGYGFLLLSFSKSRQKLKIHILNEETSGRPLLEDLELMLMQ